MPRPGSWWRITPCGLPIANARLLHSKGRIELLHGEEFGIKVRSLSGCFKFSCVLDGGLAAQNRYPMLICAFCMERYDTFILA